jgi:hypothetical protein
VNEVIAIILRRITAHAISNISAITIALQKCQSSLVAMDRKPPPAAGMSSLALNTTQQDELNKSYLVLATDNAVC